MLPLTPLMNNTKWDQLRLAMYDLDDFSARWRTKDLSGYLCDWDGEWFYHFRTSGYETIEWVEIQVLSAEQDEAVMQRLREIHLPSHRIEQGYRIYGYAALGAEIAYL